MKKQLTPHEANRLRYVEGDVRCVLHKCRGAPRRAGTEPETGCHSPRLKAAVHSVVRIQFRQHRGDAGALDSSPSFPSLLPFQGWRESRSCPDIRQAYEARSTFSSN